MAVQVQEQPGSNVLTIKVQGKLTSADYEHFVPIVERLIKQHGKIRILVDMLDFHGWEMSALWEDIKFDVKHFRDIERLALCGESKWQAGMATFCRPFTTAQIKYFPHDQMSEAQAWVAGK